MPHLLYSALPLHGPNYQGTLKFLFSPLLSFTLRYTDWLQYATFTAHYKDFYNCFVTVLSEYTNTQFVLI
jgi:hypothetical protein